MDPLSIVASVIAVCQAGDRIGGLLTCIQTLVNAPQEVAALFNEISNIRTALLMLQSRIVMSHWLFPSSGCVHQTLQSCLMHIASLETLVGESVSTTDTSLSRRGENIIKGTKRMTWMRKRRKIGRIKQQLKDALSAIQLELLSLNLASQAHMVSAITNIGDSFNTLQFSATLALENTHKKLIKSKYLIEVAHQNQNLALSRELEGCETFQHQYASPSPSTESNVGISDTYAQPYTPYYLNHKSPRLCIQTVGILVGLLGWSTKRASSYLCLIYHSPWWIGTLACILRLQGTPSPCISLSFRTLLPPDAEVFVCIRTGQVERLKILFIERRACVADMMGPYGLSTIAIAILYGQTEICQFLHSAVGNRMSHTLLKSKVTGSEVGKFWSTYSSLDCSVPAAAVIHDHFYDTSPELAAKVLSSLASQSCPERDSFTRLHQCVLKLTAESLETLLADPRLDINETDSLGRTALHMATYLCDIQAIDLLIRHNANHEIEEYAGKSPLRVAATMGWAEGTSLLANISTDLEQRGDFGCTILHDVCFQGHAHIVKLLLDAGANMEAMNDLLETPLRHAVVGNQVEVLKVLHERGAAFTMCDNIGCTAFHDAILVNSHPCLEFLLGLHVRVDQKYLTQGQTALHLLAENADFCTLEIFLNNAHTGLAGLDVAARDGKDFTALEYLNFRKDEEFKNTFHLLLKQVDVARQEKQHSLLKESIIQLKGNGSFVDEDENDDFADALENQAEY